MRAQNPYRGWVPVVIQDSELESIINSKKLPDSIGNLIELSKKDSGTLALPVPGAAAKQLDEWCGAPFPTNYAVFFGILWFLDDKLVVPIAMPEITADKMIGFMDSEYKLRRLDNETDITYLFDAVTERLEVADTKYAVVREETRKLIERYSLYLEQR